MSTRDDGIGGASLGRVRPGDDVHTREDGHGFFERRMGEGNESQWTRWHEEGRWRDDARNVSRAWEAREHAASGPYAGRGPRGYERTHERFREQICEALAMDGEVDATDIEVTIDGNEVTLTGVVADRAQKRRAEEVVDRVDGVHDVHNRLRLAAQLPTTP